MVSLLGSCLTFARFLTSLPLFKKKRWPTLNSRTVQPHPLIPTLMLITLLRHLQLLLLSILAIEMSRRHATVLVREAPSVVAEVTGARPLLILPVVTSRHHPQDQNTRLTYVTLIPYLKR